MQLKSIFYPTSIASIATSVLAAGGSGKVGGRLGKSDTQQTAYCVARICTGDAPEHMACDGEFQKVTPPGKIELEHGPRIITVLFKNNACDADITGTVEGVSVQYGPAVRSSSVPLRLLYYWIFPPRQRTSLPAQPREYGHPNHQN